MADKSRLFSIGKLSKLTGVHIQSLRYYEELGIIKPAYVDCQSRYRYYTFQHVRIIEAIQYCVELDIPLKDFRRFLLEKDGQIDYVKLIRYGMSLATEKMIRIQKRIAFLENIQQELIHAGECRENSMVKTYFQEKLCWAIPYEGTQTAEDFHGAVYRLISDMEAHGLRAGHNYGQLLVCGTNKMESYIFIDIREADDSVRKFTQVFVIPAGEYMCTVSKESGVRNAPQIFPELFKQNYEKTVIEVELFSGKYNYCIPTFEIRCSLP